MSHHDAWTMYRAECNDVVTLTVNVGARGEVVKARLKLRLLVEGTAECSHVPGVSRLIFVFEANFGGNVTVGFSSSWHVRKDALRLRACACVQRAHLNASTSTRSAHTRAYPCMRVSWVWGQRLSGVIESCLQGAALRCSSRALPPGEGNHNAI